MTYTPKHMLEGRPRAEAAAATTVARPVYAQVTVPLPVRTDPRKRLIVAVLGLTAASLFTVSLPLGILLLASALNATIEEILRKTGVSLIVTLWIFQQIALAAVGFYAAILVLRRKSEAGASFIAFGATAGVMCGLFAVIGGMVGAYFGVVGGALLLGAGIFDSL